MVARGILVLTAVLVLAWGALLLRDARLGASAADRAFRPGNHHLLFATALRDLERAQLLNPDRHWSLTHLSFLVGSDQWPRAIREGRRLVRAEPHNLSAWVLLRRAAAGRDPRAEAEAEAALQRLNPLGFVAGE